MDGDYSSDFTNNGTLRRGENGTDENGAALVVVNGDFSGTFTNAGRMELNVSNDGLADGESGALVGVGLAIGDGPSGFDTQVGQAGSFVASGAEITNDGVIDVELDAGGEAFAAGVAIEGDRFFVEVPIGGTATPSFTTIETETATSGLTLTNNGTIAVSATAKGGADREYDQYEQFHSGSFDDDAFAFGILLGDVELEESFRDLLIDVSGEDRTSVLTDQNYDYSRVALDGGAIVNEGTILVRAESGEDGGDASAEAYGIELGDLGATADSTVRNAGLIDIVVNAGVDATGEGISVGALGAFGLVENTGTINVAANADIDVSIEGIEVDDASTAGAVIRNTGTLNLVARTRNDVNVSGIEVDTDLAATLTNGVADPEADDANGEIIIRIYSEETDIDTVDATGIDVQGDVLAGGMIANHGLIDIYVSAQDPNDDLEINGIEADDLYGSLLNSGTINLELEAFDADDENFAIAGIYSDAIKTTGILLNSGEIDIDVVIYEGDDDDTDVNVDGIYVADEIAGQLTNSGL